ncbi:3-hydroxyacyl-ACP dehydratase FabZ family protein [Candidatus Pelagibacter communis]|uniref:3-hydroxyacyl-ACP dehydratase FabZ family protein n=1 Tax=Pelagibacter ubique TaxID=198252 RepID=UPI00065B3D7E|nr:3-hydroxyacyl-ACP dehydratase FabZ family protein [Candidatus Pelagibacter ubique]
MSKIYKKIDLLNIQKNTNEFLMMDEVEIIEENKAKGKKFFSEDFWIFQHHWPGDPNVPAVFQTEAMTQISSILILSKPNYNNKTLLVVNSNNLKFKKKIVPNQTLVVKTELLSFKRSLAKFSAKGFVNDEICCAGDFLMVLQEDII